MLLYLDMLQFIRKLGGRGVENWVTQVVELCMRRAALKTVVFDMHGYRSG
jgi:hypothetical protein